VTPRRLEAAILALAGIWLAGPAAAQTLANGASPDIPWWRVLGALAFCVALAVGAAFALRARLGGRLPALVANRPRRLELVETLRLSHQVDICLVRCDARDLIVAATPQGAFLISPGAPPQGSPQP